MPQKWTDKTYSEFLKRIGEGRSARSVCGDKDMPTWRSISNRLNENSDFAAAYSLAMENRGQVYADRISEIIDQVVSGQIDPNAGRVAIDGLKWVSSKLAPKKYGDIHRHEVKHSGSSYVEALKVIASEGENSTQADHAVRARGSDGSAIIH